MTRLGVFGGTFNPPHTAHLTVARRAMQQADLDEVLWMPAANPPHKTDEPVIDARHRMEMVRQLIRDEPAFRLSDLELRRSGPSYTVDTLEELARRHPDTHLYLIIGEDSLRRLHTWYNPERIVQIVDDILVVRRPEDADGPPVSELVSDRYTVLDGDPINVSSSDIRRALSARSQGAESPGTSERTAPDQTAWERTASLRTEGEVDDGSGGRITSANDATVDPLGDLPERVRAYILEHDLYASDPPETEAS